MTEPTVPRKTSGRTLLKILGIGALGYVGVLFVLLALENALIFRPVTAAQDWAAPPNSRVQDVELTVSGKRIHAWWCPPEDWRPEKGATLYCHGNAGNLSHRGEQIKRWQDLLGQATLIFDYPGYGRSDGSPSEAGCYAAADASFQWLVGQQRIAPERIVLHGGSLGCAVATELAVRFPHRAVVLVSPFTSMPDMAQQLYPWLPARWLVRSRFDNLDRIGRTKRPVFIAHGTADQLVPFRQGERLFEAAAEPRFLLPMQGYDHNHTPGPEFYRELQAFLTKYAPLD